MSTGLLRRLKGGKSRWTGLALGASALLVVTGCTATETATPTESPTDTASPTESADDEIVIGVAMKTQLQERWAFDVRYMEERAAELGATMIVQYADDDPALQASQVENLLSQGIDALIIVPVDDQAAATSVAAAKAEGVPVISYDIGVQGVAVDAFVIRDNPGVGTIQAETCLAATGNAGNYIQIWGDAANDVAQAISVAQTAALEGTDVNVLYADFNAKWDPVTAQATAENLLTANNDDVAAILTANDGMASGVIQALQGRGLAGEVCVTGLDATPSALKFILEGLQTVSVWTPIDQQARLAAEAAYALANGEPVDSQVMMDNGSGTQIPAVLVPVIGITADKVCEFITQIAPEGWVSVEDVYDDPSQCTA